jgi:hypothetical protein
MNEAWNKCDVCGRFIAIKDFGETAVRRLLTPDSALTAESYETLCSRHSDQKVRL